VFPYDPTRTDPRWLSFNRRFEARFHEKPEQFASLAYDAMNALLDSICKAGLNRARIHDALADIDTWDGVTGKMVFDPNQKNLAPMYLGTVRDGIISYRQLSMEKALPQKTTAATPQPSSQQDATSAPYARVGEDGVSYSGPQTPDLLTGGLRIVLFGKDAGTVSQSAAVQSALAGAGSGPPWQLLPVASDQNWGAASTQLVHALMDDHALAVIALDRDAAHLAEQLALKTFIPVLALSGDRALTSTNVPWIFRLPASATPADAVVLLRDAESRSGPNPRRLRDVLASGTEIQGMAFLPTGEPRPR
jgi:hypothetical protein